MKNNLTYEPDYRVHPGEYLEEVLSARGLKKKELAERLNTTDKTISQLINKKAYIAPDFALKLEKVLGISAEIWNNMSSEYRLFEARVEEQKQLKKDIEWLKNFPVKDLVNNKFLPDIKDEKAMLSALLAFFGVSDKATWNKHYDNLLNYVCCRNSALHKVNEFHLLSWLRAGEVRAQGIQTNDYDRDKFREKINYIRTLTIKDVSVFVKEMTEACAESGVALTFVPEFTKTHIWGITRWLTPGKALIVMSLRYKWNDHFWFTFFHEAAHILLHGKKGIFVDSKKTEKSKEEKQADNFALNIEVPSDEYNEFVEENNFSIISIRNFAVKQKIHPGIIAGRLAHDGYINHQTATRFKYRLEFVK
ncbi:MAG: HigA family addiction module antitoxin [Bacteroidota bacterium]